MIKKPKKNKPPYSFVFFFCDSSNLATSRLKWTELSLEQIKKRKHIEQKIINEREERENGHNESSLNIFVGWIEMYVLIFNDDSQIHLINLNELNTTQFWLFTQCWAPVTVLSLILSSLFFPIQKCVNGENLYAGGLIPFQRKRKSEVSSLHQTQCPFLRITNSHH